MDGADSEALEYLGRQNATEMSPEHLVRETEALARSVTAGETPNAGVMRLGELCREVARRCDAEPQPPCPADCAQCEQDDDPGHALMRRIGYRPRAIPAAEVRARDRGRRTGLVAAHPARHPAGRQRRPGPGVPRAHPGARAAGGHPYR